ncbi:MAG TPA: SpoIIE family protein phosphatase [Rhodanobacteraceae bacterium]|nr:SpoIIE family protein phosphatase [Rhodanobacteraceae bacterium]
MADTNPPPDACARILVVDDTEGNRDLLVRRLERLGHQAATAEDGRVALDMLAQGSYDLMLLDIMMPGMNGFEVLERVKADDALQHLPVILISALDDSENMARGIAMGADDYLPKPFNPLILKARVGASLARKRLHDREQLHAKAMARELEIARNIQFEFLPDHVPAIAGLELAAWLQPARHVAGDFYDTFLLGGGGRRVAVVVADVCDKGVGAALFMAVCRSLLRALSVRIVVAGGDPMAQARELVKAISDYSARTHDRANMFATLFFGILDADSGNLVYVNGGHEPPLITGPRGVRTELAPTGPAVGLLPDLEFEARSEVIEPGETLVMYTDGIIDAHDADGARFSRQRLLEIASGPAASAQTMVARIRDAVQEHARDVSPFDDITLLVAHRSI